MSEPVWMLEDLDDEVYEGERPNDVSQNDAEDHLEHIRKIRWELERELEHAARQREKVDRFVELRKESAQKKINYHEACLMRYLESHGETSMNMINGRLRTYKGRMGVDILDEKLVSEEFHKAGKPKISKTLIADHIKTTGEIPDGVDWVRGDDSFKVTLIDAPELTESQKAEVRKNDIDF